VHHAKVRAAWNAKNPKKLKVYSRRAYKKNAEKIKAASRDYTARRAAKLAEIWRPDDWSEKPIDWRIVGTELLLQKNSISNEDLAGRLDAARVLRCPFSKDGTWGCITRPGQAANYISKIRKWVKRPGKSPSHR
jgi:hypothetical protein